MVYHAKIEGVSLTKLKVISTEGGSVMHGLKSTEDSFSGFGEAYFSTVAAGTIRGWKRHRHMTLNLIVIVGEIRFVLIDDRGSLKELKMDEITLSREHSYGRLTVPPGIWMAFQGIESPTNVLANIANIEHDPLEADQVPLDDFDFVW